MPWPFSSDHPSPAIKGGLVFTGRTNFLAGLAMVIASVGVGIYIIFFSQAATSPLQGDINNDNTVDIFDLSILLANFAKPAAQASDPDCDMNASGTVDITDLSILLSNYGKSGDITPPTPATLAATAGDRQAYLSWAAATDNNDIVRYEIWKNDSYLVGLPGTVLSHIVAYDAAGNFSNSNTATVVPVGTSTNSFVLAGTHPYAMAQSTASGKILTGLQEYGGKLYMGYGDTFANTGPIRITSYNPTTNSFVSEFTSDTEAVWTYRILNNRLFAPSDDPRVSADFAVGVPWNNSSAIGMTHNFDMAEFGASLYAVGSKDVNALVYRSTDGGASWSIFYSEAPITSGDIARFYFAAVFNNKLYVQGYDYYGNRPHQSSRVYNGTSLVNGPNLLPLGGHGWHPRIFGDKLIYQTHLPNNMLNTPGNDKSRLMVFNGIEATSPMSAQIWDYAISGSFVYALGVDGTIMRSSNLQDWMNFAPAPAGSRSIGFLGQTMYVGTVDSKLYKFGATPP